MSWYIIIKLYNIKAITDYVYFWNHFLIISSKKEIFFFNRFFSWEWVYEFYELLSFSHLLHQNNYGVLKVNVYSKNGIPMFHYHLINDTLHWKFVFLTFKATKCTV